MKNRNPDNKSALKLLYLSRSDGTDTRISKECKSLKRHGHDVLFLGWDRNPDKNKPDPMPGIKKHIYVTAAQQGKSLRAFFHFLRYWAFIASTLLRERPGAVHAVNEEMAFIVLALKPVLGFRLVCDIFDSISLRYAHLKFPLNIPVKIVCGLAWMCSDALLLTDERRAGRLPEYRRKIRIVANYPEDPGSELMSKTKVADNVIRLYVGGTLYRERGLRQLMRLMDMNPDVRAVCAGWVYDDQAREFIVHPSVQYLGVLTPADSLATAAGCDAVVALYDPCNQNNVWASPNKIYDAMCIGRPVLLNRETHISAWVQAENIGYICEYDNVGELNNAMDLLRTGKAESHLTAARIRKVFERGYSWGQAEKELFAAYNEIL
jgi:glycosyltransferase involved in cell wall biosynthesis